MAPLRVLSTLLLVAVCLARPAQAFDSGWDLRLEAGTSFPLSIGGRATLVAPAGFFVTAGVGWLPEPYGDVINDIAVAFDAYDRPTADLISQSLEDSLVVEGLLGFDPGEARGFWFAASYSLVTLGAGVSARSAVEAVLGVTIPQAIPDLQIPLTSSVHFLGGTVGWTAGLSPLLELTVLANVQTPIASASSIDVDRTGPAIDAVQNRVDEFFDDAYSGLVVPSLGVYLGARF